MAELPDISFLVRLHDYLFISMMQTGHIKPVSTGLQQVFERLTVNTGAPAVRGMQIASLGRRRKDGE
ncbi:MAG TPA: hypothetical protein VHZ55_28315 [Bryobacteraceae bacterium]|nr:hypothetical protein [Bryobacteraceae bacterium]